MAGGAEINPPAYTTLPVLVPFIDRLIEQVRSKKSPVVVGIDPLYEHLPASLRKQGEVTLAEAALAVEAFARGLIDAVYDLVPAVKLQIAFFERLGAEGMAAFARTIAYAKGKGLLVIDDAKRNDIGTTATAYSDCHLGRTSVNGTAYRVFDADALTVTPYLGVDGVMPFIKDAQRYGKGVFVLVKTSNPSGATVQDLTVVREDKSRCKLYEAIAGMVDQWGTEVRGECGYSSVGAVVGATYPEDAALLRRIMPQTCFLVPGYGAQGAGAWQVARCFNRDGMGALIAASRSIMYAFKEGGRHGEESFGEAAREAVLAMNRDIAAAVGASFLR